MIRDNKIYVAGHRGLVGSAILRRLEEVGYTNLVCRTHEELDLTNQRATEAFFAAERPDYVFVAAAKVGGIGANKSYPVDFLLKNLRIQNNVIEASWRHGVRGLLFLGSSCIYPKLAPQPLKEEYLLKGPLEPTNEPYAIAKIAGIKLCEAFNRQHGTSFLCAMPTNLYGPNDNYDLDTSHVLPALIRKFHLAKLAANKDWEAIQRDEARYGKIPEDVMEGLFREGGPVVRLWGSGTPRREFLYVDDMAEACIFLMKRIDNVLSELKDRPLVNIGCGKDMSVRELAELVSKVVGFEVQVEWDKTKPDGTPLKLMEVSAMIELGWESNTSLGKGINLSYQDYLSKTPP